MKQKLPRINALQIPSLQVPTWSMQIYAWHKGDFNSLEWVLVPQNASVWAHVHTVSHVRLLYALENQDLNKFLFFVEQSRKKGLSKMRQAHSKLVND